VAYPKWACSTQNGAGPYQKGGGWLKSGYGMYWECFTVILGGVVGLKGAGHGGAD
jgi:hypothetical protein